MHELRNEGGVAEWFRRIWWFLVQNPLSCHEQDFFSVALDTVTSTPRALFVNNQLVYLPSVAIFNKLIFSLFHVNFICSHIFHLSVVLCLPSGTESTAWLLKLSLIKKRSQDRKALKCITEFNNVHLVTGAEETVEFQLYNNTCCLSSCLESSSGLARYSRTYKETTATIKSKTFHFSMRN